MPFPSHGRLLTPHGQFQPLAVDAVSDYRAAAATYRRCRRAGFTPRGLTDCLIVTVARRTDAVLLASDVDLVRVAEVLRLDPAPLA